MVAIPACQAVYASQLSFKNQFPGGFGETKLCAGGLEQGGKDACQVSGQKSEGQRSPQVRKARQNQRSMACSSLETSGMCSLAFGIRHWHCTASGSTGSHMIHM